MCFDTTTANSIWVALLLLKKKRCWCWFGWEEMVAGSAFLGSVVTLKIIDWASPAVDFPVVEVTFHSNHLR